MKIDSKKLKPLPEKNAAEAERILRAAERRIREMVKQAENALAAAVKKSL